MNWLLTFFRPTPVTVEQASHPRVTVAEAARILINHRKELKLAALRAHRLLMYADIARERADIGNPAAIKFIGREAA